MSAVRSAVFRTRREALVTEERSARLNLFLTARSVVGFLISECRRGAEGTAPPDDGDDRGDWELTDAELLRRRVVRGDKQAELLKWHGEWESYEIRSRELRRVAEPAKEEEGESLRNSEHQRSVALSQLQRMRPPSAASSVSVQSLLDRPRTAAAHTTGRGWDVRMRLEGSTRPNTAPHGSMLEGFESLPLETDRSAPLIENGWVDVKTALDPTQELLNDVARRETLWRSHLIVEERAVRADLIKRRLNSVAHDSLEMQVIDTTVQAEALALSRREERRRLAQADDEEHAFLHRMALHRTAAARQHQAVRMRKQRQQERQALEGEESASRLKLQEIEEWVRTRNAVVHYRDHLSEMIGFEEDGRRAQILAEEDLKWVTFLQFHYWMRNMDRQLDRHCSAAETILAQSEDMVLFAADMVILQHQADTRARHYRDVMRRAFEASEKQRIRDAALFPRGVEAPSIAQLRRAGVPLTLEEEVQEAAQHYAIADVLLHLEDVRRVGRKDNASSVRYALQRQEDRLRNATAGHGMLQQVSGPIDKTIDGLSIAAQQYVERYRRVNISGLQRSTRLSPEKHRSALALTEMSPNSNRIDRIALDGSSVASM